MALRFKPASDNLFGKEEQSPVPGPQSCPHTAARELHMTGPFCLSPHPQPAHNMTNTLFLFPKQERQIQSGGTRGRAW